MYAEFKLLSQSQLHHYDNYNNYDQLPTDDDDTNVDDYDHIDVSHDQLSANSGVAAAEGA